MPTCDQYLVEINVRRTNNKGRLATGGGTLLVHFVPVCKQNVEGGFVGKDNHDRPAIGIAWCLRNGPCVARCRFVEKVKRFFIHDTATDVEVVPPANPIERIVAFYNSLTPKINLLSIRTQIAYNVEILTYLIVTND
jgi:hypothetical protein